MAESVLQSTIACPHCGHAAPEVMPTDACQWFYERRNCHALLHPKPGDCCVFCSYGSVKCPPMQADGAGRTGAAGGSDYCRTPGRGSPGE